MITRRMFLGASTGAAIGLMGPGAALAELDEDVEIESAPWSAEDGSTPIPLVDLEMFDGELDLLWTDPWEIGTQAIELPGTIVQRFVGSETEGFALGSDGLVFRSVLYIKHGFQRYAFVGLNTDLSELGDTKTVIVMGTYGGVTFNSSSHWDDPIVIAHAVRIPA